MPPPPSLDELLQYYEHSWISSGYESPEEEAKYREYGREILTRFWEIHSANFHLPVAIEKLFYIDIVGIKLRGFIDRVDKLESNGLSIVDYKSGKELFTTDYLQKDLQLTLYQMAAEEMWRLPVERLTLYHLRSNTPCSCPPREEEQLEQVRQLVLKVAENITQERFSAIERDDCPCDFPEYCPYYRHQYMVTEERAAYQEQLPGIIVTDAVEKYAAVQEQIKVLQRQLDEAKRDIVEFCQSEGVRRVFGSEHAVTYRWVERTGFEEGQVREFLQETGLWEKVLSFDQSLVKQLLTDEEVPRDIKERLKAMQKVISAYPQLNISNRAEEEE